MRSRSVDDLSARVPAQTAISDRQGRELATLSFIANGEDVLFLGPPSVGKTHPAIARCAVAIQHATRVYFTTAWLCRPDVSLLSGIHASSGL